VRTDTTEIGSFVRELVEEAFDPDGQAGIEPKRKFTGR
jgi:hypothetical protein